MKLKDYKTKVSYVKAIQWDGTDATYNVIAPIIKTSIVAFTKFHGSDEGKLRIRKNSTEGITVNKGDYIVILDEKLGTFKILPKDTFNARYELSGGSDSGLIPDEDGSDEIITPPSTDDTEDNETDDNPPKSPDDVNVDIIPEQ